MEPEHFDPFVERQLTLMRLSEGQLRHILHQHRRENKGSRRVANSLDQELIVTGRQIQQLTTIGECTVVSQIP